MFADLGHFTALSIRVSLLFDLYLMHRGYKWFQMGGCGNGFACMSEGLTCYFPIWQIFLLKSKRGHNYLLNLSFCWMVGKQST
jgi:hypothetical protein